VLGAQRDPEVEQLDGAFQRVSLRSTARRVADRVGQVRAPVAWRMGRSPDAGGNASGGSGRLMRSVSPSGT
jgi:hypothetical protein